MKTSLAESNMLRFLWAGIAFGIYLMLIVLLLYYFNHRQDEKPKHFVQKDEKRIALASMAPQKLIKIKTIEAMPKTKPIKQIQKIQPPKIQPKAVEKPKVRPTHKKSVIKEKIVKTKIKEKKYSKPIKTKEKVVHKVKEKTKKVVNKPKKTSDLFSSIQTQKRNSTKVVKNKMSTTQNVAQTSQKVSKSMQRQKASDSGIENAYFAKVQNLLETWPAQSDYAGEKAMVRLYVKPTGLFEFKVKSKSDNVDFNLGLIDFLMQLQKLGFGAHKGAKTYEFEVEFIAKQ